MKSYTHLVKFLADLDYRQQALKDKKHMLLRQRQALEEQLKNAFTDGSDYADCQTASKSDPPSASNFDPLRACL